MLIDGQYWSFVTDVIAECERHGDRMVEFVPFTQVKINKPIIHFLSDSNFPLLGAFLCLPFSFFLADIAQQLLIMEMFLITVVSRAVYRRKYHDLESLE